MNYSIIRYILCRVLEFQAVFLALPCIASLVYREKEGWAYAIVLAGCLLAGVVGKMKKPKSTVFYAREGFVTVSLSWIILSLTGALPLFLSGEFPSYTDALFETISGLTTTGASILPDVEALSKCNLFWRSFTHWIGGMGVLVLILAVLPLAGGYNMHLMRAESPGPTVGKLVPRVKYTARNLYKMYVVLTVVQIVLLLVSGMSPFESMTLSFGTAGTGGFGVLNSSIGSYPMVSQAIITVFMILFGINFNVYYLIWTKKPLQALRHEEMRYYLGIILGAILLITINIQGSFHSLLDAVHHAAFQVASIITTTGYSTADFNQWPEFSKFVLVLLMFVGACAGSTGGGIKVSRIVIMLKLVKNELSYLIHPKRVRQIHFEKHVVNKDVLRSISVFFIAYAMVYGASVLFISLDELDFTTNFTAVAATLNNIGPGLGQVGPAENFAVYSQPAKYVLMFDMLAGRLELFPILLLFTPSTWKRR
ncbi:MAG: TrkH family potassium uptake protein [Lachnospiraceae bacterium]|jgi:trk system potassium uptake protein TrkH|nr:TrkH family potassium uptake protein [Lachnospiraceae bacterium]